MILPTRSQLLLAFRVLLAVVGGYFAANAIALLFSHLYPGSIAEGSMTAVIASFAIYSVLITWCFATHALMRTTIILAAISGLSLVLSFVIGGQA